MDKAGFSAYFATWPQAVIINAAIASAWFVPLKLGIKVG
jgi:hypothetical protein